MSVFIGATKSPRKRISSKDKQKLENLIRKYFYDFSINAYMKHDRVKFVHAWLLKNNSDFVSKLGFNSETLMKYIKKLVSGVTWQTY